MTTRDGMKKKPESNNKPVPKNKGGRPSKYSPEVVAKLKSALQNGFNIDQACLYAEISPDTFYRWIDKRKGFSEQMVRAKERPNMKAKEVVIASINNGDTTDAKWWLERRMPEEFGKSYNDGGVTNNFNFFAIELRKKYDIK